jgi:hypothetical protein
MEKLQIKTTNLFAEGIYIDGSITILKGSKAKKDISASFPESMQNKRDEMINAGILIDCDDCLMFAKDYSCKSASEASNLINGASTNGLLVWKDSNGKTLKWKMRNDPLYNNEIE